MMPITQESNFFVEFDIRANKESGTAFKGQFTLLMSQSWLVF